MSLTPDEERIQCAVCEHVENVRPGQPKEAFAWELGPLQHDMPHFRVLRIPPDDSADYWIYITVGSWFGTRHDGHGHEFILHSPVEEPLHVELLAQLTHYNADPQHRLSVGHTVPIGRPWLGDSRADHVALAPPHAYSETFEYLTINRFLVHFLWVLPLAKQEVAFIHDEGFEALEDRLESAQVDLTDPNRPMIA